MFLRCGNLILIFIALMNIFWSTCFSSELDPYGGLKEIKVKKTGFFHLQKINQRHWMVTPEGHAFYPVSLSHLYSGDSDVACRNIYKGDKQKWAYETLKKYKSMGYNCALGSVTSPERNLNQFVEVEKIEAMFREENFPYTVGLYLIKHPWEFVEGETLPDIYSKNYTEKINQMARRVCQQYKDDPLVMGYYYGYGAFNKSDIWVNHHLSLPNGSEGRNAVVELLKKRYKSVNEFNEVYKLNLSSIDELKTDVILSYDKVLDKRNLPLKFKKKVDQRQLDDFEAILSSMAENLYRIGHNAICKWDKNHLIFGSFIKEWALSSESWQASAPYLDLAAPQHYNKQISFSEITEKTNLPVIVSDDYFGFCYAHDHKAYCKVNSHEDRAELYEQSLKRHYSDPNVVGVTYCACMYDQGGSHLEKGFQDGFYDIFGRPRQELINAVTKINLDVYHYTTQKVDLEKTKHLTEILNDSWTNKLNGYGLW